MAKDTFSIDDGILTELREKAIRSPHSVSPDVHAVVMLTEFGIKKFKVVTKNRPVVSKTEGNRYHFDWPELQLEEYFKRFGRDALVLEPDSLKERIRNFYYYGLREYSK